MLKLNLSKLSAYVGVVTSAAVVFLLIGCSNDSGNSKISIIDIEKGMEKGKEVLLSKFCSNIDYIPLQTVDDAVIGTWPEIQESNGYLILKYSECKNLKVFDSTGKFINTIGILGNAANEYSKIEGFDTDNENRLITINDFRKLLFYDYSGKLLKSIMFNRFVDTNFSAYMVVLMDKGNICTLDYSFEEDLDALSFADSAGSLLNRINFGVRGSLLGKMIIDGETAIVKSSRPPYIYNYKNSIRYIDPQNDTILTYSDTFKKSSSYVTYFGKYKKDSENASIKSIKLIPKSFKESEDAIFLKFVAPLNQFNYLNPHNRRRFGIYHKRENFFIPLHYNTDFQSFGLKNDLDSGMPFWPDLITEMKMYQIIDAMTFIQMSQLSGSSKMKEIASQLTENSNPVIIVVTIK